MAVELMMAMFPLLHGYCSLFTVFIKLQLTKISFLVLLQSVLDKLKQYGYIFEQFTNILSDVITVQDFTICLDESVVSVIFYTDYVDDIMFLTLSYAYDV